MNSISENYSPYFRFIDTFINVGFKIINSEDPLIQEIDKIEDSMDQFFYIADIIRMKVLYTSKRSTQMIGILPEEVTPYCFMEATHPDDLMRLNHGRTLLIKLAQDLFIAEKGYTLVSTNFKIRNGRGGYSNFLIQCYLFYTSVPYKTVFFLKLHTNIDSFKKIKSGYHYYTGNDFSYFRYPDEKLLNTGNVFSDREFEIIKLINVGFTSQQIAEKLFLSVHTISTHRKNILTKAGKANMSELLHDLIVRGMI